MVSEVKDELLFDLPRSVLLGDAPPPPALPFLFPLPLPSSAFCKSTLSGLFFDDGDISPATNALGLCRRSEERPERTDRWDLGDIGVPCPSEGDRGLRFAEGSSSSVLLTSASSAESCSATSPSFRLPRVVAIVSANRGLFFGLGPPPLGLSFGDAEIGIGCEGGGLLGLVEGESGVAESSEA